MSGNPNGTLVAHTPTGGEPRPTATACGPASDTTPDLVIAMLRRVAELALQLVPLAVPNPDGTPAPADRARLGGRTAIFERRRAGDRHPPARPVER